MSILIDKLTQYDVKEELPNGVWVCAKSLGKNSLLRRIKDAYRVLLGRSKAYHFYTDYQQEIV